MARRLGPDVPKAPLNKETLGKALYVFEFIKPYIWYFIAGLVLLFVGSVIFMIFPYLAGQMVDIAQGNSELNITLKQTGLVLIVLLVLQGTMSYLRVITFANVSERGLAGLRKAVFTKLMSLSIYFFEENRVGDLISRVSADVEKLYSAFSVLLAEFLRQLIILVVGVAFLAITTPRLALIMLATFPVIVVGAMFFGRFIRKLSKERQKKIAESSTILSEVLQTIASVKAFTNEWFEELRYGKSIGEVVTISLKFARARALFSSFIVVVLFGALFFIIWMGAVMVSNDQITAGQLVAFVSYTAIIGGAIAGLGNFYTQLLSALGATQRLREILDEEPEIPQIRHIENIEKIKGDISIRDLRFSYPSRSDIEVIKGLSMEISDGQKVALVGASGAGKSTIIQLLLRFYEFKEGQILVDGQSIDKMDISEYRSHFAIVPQEVILFGGTIRENIEYGKPGASDDEIRETAQKANALEFIESFPEAFETIVGERGIKLSGGQRQRIAIARAILRDPAILLLDEATSSLDSESEKQVQIALDRLMENRTSVIIAHRLSTIRNVDKIFVLEKGVITESGTHEELISSGEGLYSHLTKLQVELVND